MAEATTTPARRGRAGRLRRRRHRASLAARAADRRCLLHRPVDGRPAVLAAAVSFFQLAQMARHRGAGAVGGAARMACGGPSAAAGAGRPAGVAACRVARHASFSFYALFFVVPLLGWAYTSAVGVPVVFLGVLPLPDFVPRDKSFGERGVEAAPRDRFVVARRGRRRPRGRGVQAPLRRTRRAARSYVAVVAEPEASKDARG